MKVAHPYVNLDKPYTIFSKGKTQAKANKVFTSHNNS
jgi:hypothetical protein